jgi:hypothetical protein
LTDPGSSGSGTQSALLRQPLTAWPELELKVNAIDFSFWCAPACGGAAAATQVGYGTAGDPHGSHVRLLGLLAYEALGGPRARVEATGRYVPVAALGEEGNAVLRRALADEWSSGGELARRLAAAAGDAEPVALASGDSATGGSQEADPQNAPAGPLKKRPFWEERAPRQALALGLVVLVGLGGYAWHRANRRSQLPSKAAPARWTPAPSPSPSASPAPAAAEAASLLWDTVLPTVGDDLQPPPAPGEANGVAAEQPASSPVQAAPPAPTGPAAPAPSTASATQGLTLPPAASSPRPSPAETPGESTPVQEGGDGATPRGQDGGPATPDKVPEGGSERQEGAPGATRVQQDEPPAAFTPAALRPKARGWHGYRPRPATRPEPQPTFWQRLFGHKEPKKAKPGKPRQ